MLAKRPKGATEKRRKSSGISGFLWMLLGAILTLMIGVFLYLSPIFDFEPAKEELATDAQHEVRPKVKTDTDNGDYEFYDVLPNQEVAAIPDETVSIDDTDEEAVPETFAPDVVVTQPREGNKPGVDVSEQTTIAPHESGSNQQVVIVEEKTTYDGESDAQATSNTEIESEDQTAPIEAAPTVSTYILQINSFGNADEADRRRAQVLMAGIDADVVKKTSGSGQVLYQVISQPMTSRQEVAAAQQRLQNNGIDSLIVEQRR